MDEHKWAEQFERELNGLMGRGKKPFRQNYHGQLQPILEVAKLCLETDFAPESQVRTQLLGKLLAKIGGQGSGSGEYGQGAGSDEKRRGKLWKETNPELDEPDPELDELDLSRVVGGVAGAAPAGCALCGCTRTASGMQEESCPECGHARSLHR